MTLCCSRHSVSTTRLEFEYKEHFQEFCHADKTFGTVLQQETTPYGVFTSAYYDRWSLKVSDLSCNNTVVLEGETVFFEEFGRVVKNQRDFQSAQSSKSSVGI